MTLPTSPPDGPPGAATPPAGRRGCGRGLLGCGFVALVLLVVGGALTWRFVGQPVWAVVTAVRDVQRADALDGRLANRAPYVPPADGSLTEAQVERFVAALERTAGGAQARLDVLQRRFAELDGRDFAWTDLWRLGDAYAGFLQLLVETKEGQVAALDAERFSAEEYAWVRAEVLRAAGLPGAGYGVAEFAGALTGAASLEGRADPTAVPAANVALVARVRERLDAVAFLAALGL